MTYHKITYDILSYNFFLLPFMSTSLIFALLCHEFLQLLISFKYFKKFNHLRL